MKKSPRIHAILFAHVVASYGSGLLLLAWNICRNWPVSLLQILNGRMLIEAVSLPLWNPISPFLFGVEMIGSYPSIFSRLYGFFNPVIYAALLIAAYRYKIKKIHHAVWLAAGACLSCGYDLRSSPDQCPECGAAP